MEVCSEWSCRKSLVVLKIPNASGHVYKCSILLLFNDLVELTMNGFSKNIRRSLSIEVPKIPLACEPKSTGGVAGEARLIPTRSRSIIGKS